jgi:hypothetical protein
VIGRRHPLSVTVLRTAAAVLALTLLAAFALTFTTSPAHAATGAQNRVGAFFSAAPTHAPATTAQSPCTRPGSIRSTPRTAAGSCVAAREVTHAIPEGRLGHIFRDAPGHLADTPANRKLLQGVADDPATTLGADKFGNTWSARILDDGTQAWTQTRNGDIINGGMNPTPRPFNPQTGLSRQQPPR